MAVGANSPVAKIADLFGQAIKGAAQDITKVPGAVGKAVSEVPAAAEKLPGEIAGAASDVVNAPSNLIQSTFLSNPQVVGPTGATGGKNPYQAPTATQNPLQDMLNQQIKPYMSMLQNVVNTEQQAIGQEGQQSWIQDSVKAPIQNFQKLTGTALKGLIPAQQAANSSFVQASATQQLLQILPSALIYHALVGNLPGFDKTQASGLQSLWQVLENTNLGLPKPASASTGDILTYLNQLQPSSTTSPSAAASGSPTG